MLFFVMICFLVQASILVLATLRADEFFSRTERLLANAPVVDKAPPADSAAAPAVNQMLATYKAARAHCCTRSRQRAVRTHLEFCAVSVHLSLFFSFAVSMFMPSALVGLSRGGGEGGARIFPVACPFHLPCAGGAGKDCVAGRFRFLDLPSHALFARGRPYTPRFTCDMVVHHPIPRFHSVRTRPREGLCPPRSNRAFRCRPRPSGSTPLQSVRSSAMSSTCSRHPTLFSRGHPKHSTRRRLPLPS